MDFSEALIAVKNGSRIARTGWNGKKQFVYLDSGKGVLNPNLREITEPFLVIRTQQGMYQPGWLASQADLLAEDWYVRED